MGHWHELFNQKTIHCYHISDTLVSVDLFTYGYSKNVSNGDTFQPLVSYSTFDLLGAKEIEGDYFQIGDTISWIRMPDDSETFVNDLSLGLLVNVEPPELTNGKFELPYDTLAPLIFIGQLKNSRTEGGEFGIQLNDTQATINDLIGFLVRHSDNSKKIIVLHADKNTPTQLMQDVTNEILKAGYMKQNIYRTAIKKTELSIGLVRM